MTPEQIAEQADLRSRLRIHPTGLHSDATEQPDLAARAGELAAELKAAAKRAKVDLEEVRASTAIKVRRDPSAFGLDKATEAAIATAVTAAVEVRESQQVLINADLDADKAAAVSVAFQHRKSMIQESVRLYLNNYFGEIEEKEMADAATTVDRREGEAQNARRTESNRRRRRREKATSDEGRDTTSEETDDDIPS